MSWQEQVQSGYRTLQSALYSQAEWHFLQALEQIEKAGLCADPVAAEVHCGLARTYLAQKRSEQAVAHARIGLEIDEMFWGPESEQVSLHCFWLGEALLMKQDFESAKATFSRALRIREDRQFPDTHQVSLEILSRLVVLCLQSKQKASFEQIHARAFAAYQATHPTGMWAKFLKLNELANQCAEAGQLHQFDELVRAEVSVLKMLLGGNHKEVAAVLACQSEGLKKNLGKMAGWSLLARSKAIEKQEDLSLFFCEARFYPLSLRAVLLYVERLLTERGNLSGQAPLVLHQTWWQIEKSTHDHELNARLSYPDNESKAEILLNVKCSAEAGGCNVAYVWHLYNSSQIAMAKSIMNFVIRELDINIGIMPVTGERAADPSAKVGRAFWPSPQQMNESIQNPQSAFSQEQLRSAEVSLNQLGFPKPFSGAFATVYRLRSSAGDWAVKCFTQPLSDQAARYRAISSCLTRISLPYFTQFEFLDTGIRVNSQWFPIVKMQWVAGQSLDTYIMNCLSNRNRLKELASKFVCMLNDLERHGIAHGDLQHGNILVVDGELRLVDYDAMFVPVLCDLKSNELGHRHYQHPQRSATDFGPFLDNFSAWVIHSSLQCLSCDPTLWEILQAGDDCLLFRHSDFIQPNHSKCFDLLLKHRHPEIKACAEFMLKILQLSLSGIPSFKAVSGSSTPVH